MTITKYQITIDGTAHDFNSYASIAEASLALATDPIRSIAWAGFDEAQKQSGLLSATALIDRFDYCGKKTAEDQPNKWPRTGIPGVAGDEIPKGIEDATALLAVAILINPSAFATPNATAAGGVKMRQAGSLRTEFFHPTGIVDPHFMEQVDAQAWMLLAKYFCAGDIPGTGRAYETCPTESTYDETWERDIYGIGNTSKYQRGV